MSNDSQQAVQSGKNAANKVDKNDRNKTVMVTIPIDGSRVVIEFVVAFCHAVSFASILLTYDAADDIRWTLLTLCITTFNTLVQFQNEGKWRFSGNLMFKVPFWGILGMMGLIGISYFVPAPVLSLITRHRVFAILVSGTVTVRQIIHAKMIFDIFQKGKEDSQ